MKRKTFFTSLWVLLVVMLFGMTALACEESSTPAEVSVVSLFINQKGTYTRGDTTLDLSDVKITVTYSDKTTGEISLSDEMLSVADRMKFNEVGTHTVEVTYMGKQCYYQFEVVAAEETEDYLAQFHPMGGSNVKNLTTSVIKAFPMTERKGYTFDGWYTEIQYVSADRVNYIGSKVVEPYVLKKNTEFYAKWIDDRTYNVTFYDGYDVVGVVEVHHGESIDVSTYPYPDERVQEGKTFTGWQVINGDTEEVTSDLTVRANFIVDKCIVRIEYANSGGSIEKVEHDYEYGTEITVGEGTNYKLPEREGHTSRFVVYYDHGEDYEEGSGEVLYEELPEDRTVTLTHAFTTIKAKFTILTYKIIIYNGKETQTSAALKSGDLALERTYEVAQRDFSVDWNTGFRFSDHTQDPDISIPTTIKDDQGVVGYKGEWAFAVDYGLATQILYSPAGLIWNKDEQIYEETTREEGETDNDWILRDGDGKYVARVYNKELTAIKGDVTVCAIYTKRTFDVTLIRKDNGQQIMLTTFKVKYLSDVNIYDALMYPNDPMVDGTTTVLFPNSDVTGYAFKDDDLKSKAINKYDPNAANILNQAVKVYNDFHPDDAVEEDAASLAALTEEKKSYIIRLYVEKLYLKENTDLSVKRQANGYYLTDEITEDNNIAEDWTVEWFTDAAWSAASKVDFVNGQTINVGNNVTLYCKDTDGRKFEVLFYYGYNFSTGLYDHPAVSPVAGKDFFTADETITPPVTTDTITKNVSGSTVSMSYVFSGWYDTPYSLYLSTGYRGKPMTDFSKRTTSTYYYAHYECTKTVSIVIYDKTQSTAYIGITGTSDAGFDYEECAVPDNTISYTMPVGMKFDMSVLFKGRSDGAGRAISGQTFYDNYKRNTFVSDNYDGVGLGAYLATRFGGATVAERVETMNAIIAVLQALIEDYKKALVSVYAHNYSGYSTGDDSEYEYYLCIFDNPTAEGKITDFVSEYNDLATRGSTIKGVLDGAGYSQELMAKLGDVDDFLNYYAQFLYQMYNGGYETKHTGFYAININNTNGFAALAEDSSTYTKLLTVCAVLSEYAEFLEDYETYSAGEVTPKYEDSGTDLNKAYGFDGVNEVKYSFSGWYNKANYTEQITTEFVFDAFTLENDRVMYAKWTDITKGPEGLVYEEVTVTTPTETYTAYVLVDYTNVKQYNRKGYADSEYYNVITNDNGDIPEVVATEGSTIEMQIPATIDKYAVCTEEAAAEREFWTLSSGSAYKKYFVKEGNAFVQASSVFSETETYYKKTPYPVIGIKAGALDNYSKYVTNVIIPLNLYFVEEGAFRGCNIRTINRTQAKVGEVALDHVVLDSNGYVIYQNERAPFVSVVGKESGRAYSIEAEKTLIAYVTDYELTEFTLPVGTKVIGSYAFYNATYIQKVLGTGSVTEIHDNAFRGASELTSFGVNGKILIGQNVTTIGENAFSYCAKATDVEVENNAALEEVGENAFALSAWYESNSHTTIVALRFTDSLGHDVGIILGHKSFSEGNSDVRYDAEGNVDANGEYHGKTSDGTLILTKGDGIIYNLIVPYAVKYICEGAFEDLNARKYTFKSIGKVEDRAFAGHPSLSKIVIKEAYENGETVLGNELFYGRGQTALTVTFPSVSVKNVVVGDSWAQYAVLAYAYEP